MLGLVSAERLLERARRRADAGGDLQQGLSGRGGDRQRAGDAAAVRPRVGEGQCEMLAGDEGQRLAGAEEERDGIVCLGALADELKCGLHSKSTIII